MASYGGAIFSEDRNSQTQGTFPKIESCTFISNTAGVDGGAIFWYNGVEGVLQNNQFNSNTATNRGGATATINSQITTSSGNTFSSNTANADSSTNDQYDEADFEYDSLDDTLSYDISSELSSLYSTYIGIDNSEIDIYPFNNGNDLCYVNIDNINSNQNGNTWNTAYNDLQDCLDDLSISGGEIWVASGTYIPTQIPQWKIDSGKSGNMHKSFILYDDIKIYGGFDATETNRDDRNWRDNPTYLSC